MGVPSTFHVDVTHLPSTSVSSIGPVGPVTVSGIPDHFTIDIGRLPKIQLGVDPLEVKPLSISMALTEIPNIRGHLPADFSVGVSVLGMELLCVRLCGEAQIITEPYRPNPCERCGDTLRPVPTPGPTLPDRPPVVTPVKVAPKAGGRGRRRRA